MYREREGEDGGDFVQARRRRGIPLVFGDEIRTCSKFFFDIQFSLHQFSWTNIVSCCGTCVRQPPKCDVVSERRRGDKNEFPPSLSVDDRFFNGFVGCGWHLRCIEYKRLSLGGKVELLRVFSNEMCIFLAGFQRLGCGMGLYFPSR